MAARSTGAALAEARPRPEPHPMPEPHPRPEGRPVAVPRPRPAPVDALAPVVSLPDGVDGGWAVAEIRPDGTLGPWTVVPGPATEEAAGPDRAIAASAPPVGPFLELRFGQLEAASGRHGEAVRCMIRALRAAATPTLRHRCLAELALVEAYASRLHRSAAYDALAEKELPGVTNDVLDLARAWRDLARGDLAEARRRLDRVEQASDMSTNPWHGTLELLASAELLAWLMGRLEEVSSGASGGGGSGHRKLASASRWARVLGPRLKTVDARHPYLATMSPAKFPNQPNRPPARTPKLFPTVDHHWTTLARKIYSTFRPTPAFYALPIKRHACYEGS